MNLNSNLDCLLSLTSLLGQDLPRPDPDEVPAEITKTLDLAQAQMQGLGPILEDLARARRNFLELDQTLDRLLTLAQEASDLPEDDQAGRESRQAEFVRLARVVARAAGRKDYDRPELSLLSPAQARAARRGLEHLQAVKASLAEDLAAQETLIVEAAQETLAFLETLTWAYPQAPSLAAIPDLLQQAALLRSAAGPGLGPGPDQRA